MRRFGKPTIPSLKYMAEELYTLLSTLLPCEPVDGSNTRHLNHSHPSVPNSLKYILYIVSYYDTYFSFPNLAAPPKFNYNRNTFQFITPSESTPFPSIVESHDESNTVPPSPVINPYSTIVGIPHTPHALSLLLPDFIKLFFIQYIPTRFIQPQWFPSRSTSILSTLVITHNPSLCVVLRMARNTMI